MKKLKLSRLIANKGYIDASSVNYLVMAISAVAVSVGTAVGILIRRAKKKLKNTMGIDENKNKVVEGDDIIVSDASVNKAEKQSGGKKKK